MVSAAIPQRGIEARGRPPRPVTQPANGSGQLPLSRRTAVVTGAAGAIGSAIARKLAADGAHVVLVDINEAALLDVAGSLECVCSAKALDLRDASAISDLVATLADNFPCVDILVNNAGALSNNKAESTSIEEWRQLHNLNIEAAFLLTKAFLPAMRGQGWGRIINMSSYAAKSGGMTAGTAYSVSKAALIGLTFSIAREVAGQGITSNAIAPAYVMSPMVSEQLTEAQRREQMAQIPVNRFCRPEEVAHTVSFLASPLAGFITGEVIDMNGGLHFD